MYGSPQRKSRLDAAAAAGSSSTGLQLPGEVLLAIFARLELGERHWSLPLVCRRWQRLAYHPSLLECLPARLGSTAQPRALFLPRLRAFVRWLALHAAAHAVHVSLALHVPDGVSRSGLRLALAELKEVLAQGCPRLASLALEVNQEAHAGGWLAQLRTLRTLRVASAERLRVVAQWQASTSLRELELDGGPGRRLRITPQCLLPPCLTRLTLAGERSDALPPQVAELTGLLSLTLVNARHAAPGLLPLSRLTGLESLALEGCSALPPAAALAALRSLKALQLLWCGRPAAQHAGAARQAAAGDSQAASSGICGDRERQAGRIRASSHTVDSSSCRDGGSGGEADCSGHKADCPASPANEAALLQAALRSLPHLTLLRFASTHHHAAFPGALAGLTRLQTFDWGGPAPAQPRMPPGPWLARLRSATLPADVAAASLAVLSAAWQLEELLLAAAAGRASHAQPQYPDIVRWAARHPPLQLLTLPRTVAVASSSRRAPGSSASSSSASSSPACSSVSAGAAASGVECCSSARWPSASAGQGDVSLDAALQEARSLRPALVVRCR